MAKTLVCVTEEEPNGFHGTARGFSARLSFATGEQDAAAAKGQFAAFLKGLEHVRIVPYALAGNTLARWKGNVQMLSEPWSPGLAQRFLSWLDAHPNNAQPRFYAEAGQLKGPDDSTKTEALIDAHDAIMATASRPAPLPHLLRLAFAVRVIPGIDPLPEHFVMVPEMPDVPQLLEQYDLSGQEQANGQFAPGQMVTLRDPADTNQVWSWRCNISKIPDRLHTRIDTSTGFCSANPGGGNDVYQLLRQWDLRGGALFNGYLAAQEVAWPKTDQLSVTLRRLAWRAVNSLACALDTILLALKMPGQSQRDGALVATFLDGMQQALDDAQPGQRYIAFSGATRKQLRAAMRAGLAKLAVAPPGNADARKELVDWLRQACALDSQRDVQESSDWLTWLLHGYIYCDDEAQWKRLEDHANKLLPTLAAHAPGGTVDPERALSAELEQQLSTLHDTLTSEAGTEAAIVGLLKREEVKTAFATALTSAGGNRSDAEALFAESMWRYEAALSKDRIDGAHDARVAVGTLLSDLLLQDCIQTNQDTSALRTAAENWNFWHHRFDLSKAPAAGIGEAQKALIHPVPDPTGFFSTPATLPSDTAAQDSGLAAVQEAARLMQEAVLRELFPDSDTRFVPDQTPRPLAVQFAVDPAVDDDDSIDDFAAAFAGMAMLVKRLGGQWAYGHLGEFLEPNSDERIEELKDAAPIVPLPTTVSDGRRNLFISYDGVPFTSAAFHDSQPGDGGNLSVPPFFRLDYPLTQPAGAPLPPLAYGCRYAFAAHAIGRSGILPTSLQEPNRPWRPQQIDETDFKQFVCEYDCRRTTAIGKIDFVEEEQEPQQQRLGKVPSGVHPIAADYPRIGLTGGQTLELFRDGRGAGTIALPRSGSGPSRVVLRDIFCWADPAVEVTLKLQLMQRVNAKPDDPPFGELSVHVTGGLRESLEIIVARNADSIEITCDDQRAPAAALVTEQRLWLRLRLEGKGAAISLADLSRETERQSAEMRATSDHLLLLGGGPAQMKWKAPHDEPGKLAITYPRVGWPVFRQWINNAALRDQVLVGLGDVQKRKFRNLMMSAYINRASVKSELPALLERLPDPAVTEIELTVLPLDGVHKPIDELTRDRSLAPVTQIVMIPTIGDTLTKDAIARKAFDDGEVPALLHRLDELWRLRITATVADTRDGFLFDKNGDKVLQVPAGMCVQLTARPRVPAAHFTGGVPVIEPRLRELALHYDGQHVVFAGESMKVESMLGPLVAQNRQPGPRLTQEEWAAMCTGMVCHEPAGTARAYDLSATATFADWHWRQLGIVEVSTQRWRFMGRPIYAWFNPREAVFQPKRGSPDMSAASLRLAHDNDKLRDFEAEAFDGHDPAETEPTQALLAPAGTRSRLITVTWEKPSATLFRHRFQLRSRYQGAMEDPVQGACDAWQDDTPDHASWLRVVMLADVARIALTRPQLRALIPLTVSADDEQVSTDDKQKTPPALALLQEPPLTHGGLAERIACEIKTGIGYHYNTGRMKVEPKDARKEIGPDPGLSYVAFDATTAACTLLGAEGPIGLTKDPAGVSAPAFANTGLVLQPQLLTVGRNDEGKSVTTLAPLPAEEHFMGVSLRRYLDPNWLVGAVKVNVSQPKFDAVWWMECRDGSATLSLVDDEATMKVLQVEVIDADASVVQITVNRIAIDATVFDKDSADPWQPGDPLILATMPVPAGDALPKLALLHQPLDQSRASLSVFWVLDSTTGGVGTGPALLASVEWAVPAGHFPDKRIALKAAGAQIMPVSISAPTTLQWVRMQRNFDRWSFCLDNGDRVSSRAADLRASLQKGGAPQPLRFELVRRNTDGTLVAAQPGWLIASTAFEPAPLYRQRHVAVLFSRYPRGPGRTIEMLTAAHMLPATDSQVAWGEDRPDAVRLMELELPATLLGYDPTGQSGAVPVSMRVARFDLTAIGVDRKLFGQSPVQLSFCARIVASQSTRKDLRSIVLELRSDVDLPGAAITLELNRTADGELHAFYFDMAIIQGQLGAISARSQDRSGTLGAPAPGGKATLALVGAQGLVMTIADAKFAQGNKAIFWLEIAMLATSTATAGFTGAVDFDWLFGAEEASARDVLHLATLQTMYEAQGRVIAVSPPIEVTI